MPLLQSEPISLQPKFIEPLLPPLSKNLPILDQHLHLLPLPDDLPPPLNLLSLPAASTTAIPLSPIASTNRSGVQLSSGSKQQAMKEAVTSYLNKSKPRNQQAFKIKKVSPTPEIKASND